MLTSPELDKIIKQADPQVQAYIEQLQKEMGRLLTELGKREALITKKTIEFDQLREKRLKSFPENPDAISTAELEEMVRLERQRKGKKQT